MLRGKIIKKQKEDFMSNLFMYARDKKNENLILF